MGILKYLLLEYSDKLRKQLIAKFKKEDGQLTDETINAYIDTFDRLKTNFENRDITTYSWKELEGVVDSYRGKMMAKKRAKMKNSGQIANTDKNLLYSKGGITVYKGSDRESCVTYGDGYSFCISHKDKNMNRFMGYRKMNGGGIPYFVFNANLPKSHRYHLVVIYAWVNNEDGQYTVTDALNDNNNEITYKTFDEMMDAFNRKDVWGMKPTFLKDILKPEPLKIHELYEDFVDKGTHYEISSANLSSMGLTELPRYWEMV